jgi:hypothetical protein
LDKNIEVFIRAFLYRGILISSFNCNNKNFSTTLGIIQPLHLKMHRTTRIKRAANREPTSLAATVAPSLHENEAIDVVETLTSEANIDPVLITLGEHDIDPPPPPPPQLLDCLDPDDDAYLSIDFESPLPSLPESQQTRAISWSPTPPPASRPQLATQPPPPLIVDDIQPQIALR